MNKILKRAFKYVGVIMFISISICSCQYCAVKDSELNKINTKCRVIDKIQTIEQEGKHHIEPVYRVTFKSIDDPTIPIFYLDVDPSEYYYYDKGSVYSFKDTSRYRLGLEPLGSYRSMIFAIFLIMFILVMFLSPIN